jgi:GNAT superfamily N-acetyltransferase
MTTIAPAAPGDLDTILAMRAEASTWLATKGIDQWRSAWPTQEAMTARITASIAAGETWMVRDDDGTVAATVALDDYADPHLWTPDECSEPALYLHRLIVRRSHAGLGRIILDWASCAAAELACHWLRIDVWTDNLALQHYYTRNGFQHVRTDDHDDYPSGALFQRPARVADSAQLGGLTSARLPS